MLLPPRGLKLPSSLTSLSSLAQPQPGQRDHCVDSSGAGQWIRTHSVCRRSHFDISFFCFPDKVEWVRPGRTHPDFSPPQLPCLKNRWLCVTSETRETVFPGEPCAGAAESVAATCQPGTHSCFLASILSHPLCLLWVTKHTLRVSF